MDDHFTPVPPARRRWTGLRIAWLVVAGLVLWAAIAWADFAQISDVQLEGPSTLVVGFHRCVASYDARVEWQDADRVVIRATGWGLQQGDCLAGASVRLDAPLGDRPVIDAKTGAEVRVAGR